jgi:hypothetical protein
MYESELIRPVLVNHKIDAPKNWLKDNEGENISEKNPHYCELTAMYWAWKNLPAEHTHVGLFHYRRMLAPKKQGLFRKSKYKISSAELNKYYSDEALLKALANHALLLPLPERQDMSIEKHYRCRHIPEDWNILMEVLEEMEGDRFSAIQNYFKTTKRQYWANMFVMERALFDAYAAWLFSILFKVEKRLPISAHPYQARVFGFMAERLQNLYFNVINPVQSVQNLPCIMPKEA